MGRKPEDSISDGRTDSKVRESKKPEDKDKADRVKKLEDIISDGKTTTDDEKLAKNERSERSSDSRSNTVNQEAGITSEVKEDLMKARLENQRNDIKLRGPKILLSNAMTCVQVMNPVRKSKKLSADGRCR